jgi:GNAT superfamily N-acetyltransferase
LLYRQATVNDIAAMHIVRCAVTENALSTPALITPEEYKIFITQRGQGWVCEVKQTIVGFAIADLVEHNVWALFVHPNQQQKGIGKQLHQLMLQWYFTQTQNTIWLGTEFNTRAQQFYTLMGWQRAGLNGTNEARFEMSSQQWQQLQQKNLGG